MIAEGTMKAVVYDEYGPPEVLKLREVDMPVPQTMKSWSGCTRHR